MKWLLPVLIYFSFINYAITQEKVGIVDLDSFVNLILKEYEFESAYLSIEDTTFKLVEKWVELFKDKIDRTIASVSCGSPAAFEHARQLLVKEEKKLISLDKYLKDTLPNYKSKVMYDIECYLTSEYNEVGLIEGYDLIVKKNQILYFDENSFYSDFELKNKINYKAEVHKIIDTFIKKTNAKYQEHYLGMKNDNQ